MSKRKTYQRASKPAFSMTGVVAGACTGLIIGLIVEVVWRRSMIVMQAGGVAGIAAGALIESVRLWWRKHAFQKLHEGAKPPATLRR